MIPQIIDGITRIFRYSMQISIRAVWVVLLAFAVRFLARKAEGRYLCILWMAAFFAFLCPMSFGIPCVVPQEVMQKIESIVPGCSGDGAEQVQTVRMDGRENAGKIDEEPGENQKETGELGDSQFLEDSWNQEFMEWWNPGYRMTGTAVLVQNTGTERAPVWIAAAACLWFTVLCILLLWQISKYIRMKRRLATAVKLSDQVYATDQLDSPVLFGYVYPLIYLPAVLEAETMRYAVLHEQMHISRRDYLCKLAAFVISTVYWWNPLIWLMYRTYEGDMEQACDEAVLRQPEVSGVSYAQALLDTACLRSRLPGIVAFGAGHVKGRVCHILSFQQTDGKRRMLSGIMAVVFVFVSLLQFQAELPVAIPEISGAELWQTIQFASDVLSVQGEKGQNFEKQAGSLALFEDYEGKNTESRRTGNMEAWSDEPELYAREDNSSSEVRSEGMPEREEDTMKTTNKLGMILAGTAILGGTGNAGMTVRAEGQVPQTNESLSLCIDDLTREAFQSVFDAYQEKYPDVKLEIETYAGADYQNARQKMNTQLMAGEGPDLLLLGVYDTDDVYKLMKAQLFAPLDAYMAQDTEYQAEDYVQGVFEAGRFGGQQYIVPLEYTAPCVMSSEECLADLGFDPDACDTFDGLFSQMAALYDTDYQNRVMASSGWLDGFAEMTGLPLLDYENEEVLIDTPEMRTAMEQYQKMYAENITAPPESWYCNGKVIIDREAYLSMDGCSPYTGMMIAGGISTSETPVVIPIRTEDGKTNASIVTSAAVRANSPNQQNAWNLIRMILEAQGDAAASASALPVNKAGVHAVMEEYAEIVELNAELEPEELHAVSQEFIESYESLLTSPEHAIFARKITLSDLTYGTGKMVPFFEGKASYEECMQEYVDYASIYVSE